MERFALRFIRSMHGERMKTFWMRYQRALPARIIAFVTANLVQVQGLEYFEQASHDRPILLVANHRSFFDMYVVSAVLLRRTSAPIRLFFPVRGRFFYQSPLALIINALTGWAMYPPIFHTAAKRSFNSYSFRVLTDLCRTGRGHMLGFHPEGTRNRNPDPYSYLRPQPGVGQLIMEAEPQVIPVFIAGLDNSVRRQIARNWRGGEPIRIYFGPVMDLSAQFARENRLRTHKEIADVVMTRIRELGEIDRARRADP